MTWDKGHWSQVSFTKQDRTPTTAALGHSFLLRVVIFVVIIVVAIVIAIATFVDTIVVRIASRGPLVVIVLVVVVIVIVLSCSSARSCSLPQALPPHDHKFRLSRGAQGDGAMQMPWLLAQQRRPGTT